MPSLSRVRSCAYPVSKSVSVSSLKYVARGGSVSVSKSVSKSIGLCIDRVRVEPAGRICRLRRCGALPPYHA
jgi:hypothetical protein